MTEVGMVSKGCCNKLPPTAWLKTTAIYSITGLGAESPKSRCWPGHAPSGGSREVSDAYSSSRQFSLACGCLPRISASPGSLQGLLLCASPRSVSHKGTSQGVGACLDNPDELISISLVQQHLQRPFSQIRSHSQVLGIRTWAQLWGRGRSQPTAKCKNASFS